MSKAAQFFAVVFVLVTCPAVLAEPLNLPQFSQWKAAGTAFQKRLASGDLLKTLEIENATGPVATSELDGDGPTGTLTSPEFKIERRFISFRIAGGNYEIHTCLNLLVNGKIVKSATGWRSDRLMPSSWDVSPWMGQLAQAQIVDEASGDWGHLNVERIIQTDKPERAGSTILTASFTMKANIICSPSVGRSAGCMR
jgi:fructan beta-fructosidase